MPIKYAYANTPQSGKAHWYAWPKRQQHPSNLALFAVPSILAYSRKAANDKGTQTDMCMPWHAKQSLAEVRRLLDAS